MFIPDSAQTYASHKLFILYFPQCWIIAVFHRRMKVPNKIIHNKLLSGEKITSLYSFGGTCILKGCLKRKHLTQRGQNLGGKFQPSGRQLGRYMGGRNNILLSLETPHGDYLLTTFFKMIFCHGYIKIILMNCLRYIQRLQNFFFSLFSLLLTPKPYARL